MRVLDSLRSAADTRGSIRRESAGFQRIVQSAVLDAVWQTWGQFKEIPRDFDPITAVMERLAIAQLSRQLRATEGEVIDACLSLLIDLEIQARQAQATPCAVPAPSIVQ